MRRYIREDAVEGVWPWIEHLRFALTMPPRQIMQVTGNGCGKPPQIFYEPPLPCKKVHLPHSTNKSLPPYMYKAGDSFGEEI